MHIRRRCTMPETLVADAVVHTRTCSICEAACGLLITVENNAVTRIVGDAADPLSKGHICPKAYGLWDMQNDPDRLRAPMQRTGDTWAEMSWDDAFDVIETRLATLQAAHGPNSVGVYRGNPSAHNLGLMTHGGGLSRALKTKANFSASTVDQIPLQLTAMWMYGHNFLIPVIDIDRAHTVLMLGANPLASNGSLWTVPGAKERLEAMIKPIDKGGRGGKLIVIDPRKSETAHIASQHVPIKPTGDAAFLIALLLTLKKIDAVKPGRLADMLTGYEDMWAAISIFSIDALSKACGISVATINSVAHDLAAAPVAAVYGRMGTCTQKFGTLCQWLIQVLNITLGSVDREGGVMFTAPAVDTVALTGAGSYGRFHSRVSNYPETLAEFPAACLAEEITTPGDGQIRAMITIAGNPVLSTPNGAQLDAAFDSLDFMVAIDPHLTETTRHADIILPPCGPLEKSHYPSPFYHLSVRNIAKYSPPVLPKSENAKDDWEIVDTISRRMAARNNVTLNPPGTPDDALAFMLKASGKLSMEQVLAEPHGVDMGPLMPCLPERLRSADKKINCAPPVLMADLARFATHLAETAPDGLLLIGRRHIRSNNSWLHNSARLIKGPNRCTIMMHPDDARARNLGEGSTARVTSRVGAVELPVEVTDDMMPGVVSIPHGFGHGRSGVGWMRAAANPGVSCNDLTDETLLDVVSGNAAVNGVAVDVMAV
jgi:anaerobic selenocysteine-containing dehydrogenase